MHCCRISFRDLQAASEDEDEEGEEDEEAEPIEDADEGPDQQQQQQAAAPASVAIAAPPRARMHLPRAAAPAAMQEPDEIEDDEDVDEDAAAQGSPPVSPHRPPWRSKNSRRPDAVSPPRSGCAPPSSPAVTVSVSTAILPAEGQYFAATALGLIAKQNFLYWQ